jgi:hypothetical protein
LVHKSWRRRSDESFWLRRLFHFSRRAPGNFHLIQRGVAVLFETFPGNVIYRLEVTGFIDEL